MTDPLRVAVIGAGYWGPNLARNFRAAPGWDLVAVCDLDEGRARHVAGPRSTVDVLTSTDALLARDDVDAVAVATPAATHVGLVLAALDAGKHVLVEKPIAHDGAAARRMVARAAEVDRVLMVDHTFCYTAPVRKIRELVADGSLGDIQYVDSVRINLGIVQPDVDVFWDLAPHDLSVLDFVLPGGLLPTGVAAQGGDPLHVGHACVGYLTLPLPGGAIAHVHVNWLSPTKIRRMVVGGSRRTLVWDDLAPQQRLTVYDRGVDLGQSLPDRTEATVSYRIGDAWAPALQEREALSVMVAELGAAIREHRAPQTDGHAGLRVLDVLESASLSLADGGRTVPVVRQPVVTQPVVTQPAALPVGPGVAS
ncbi:Gfo/Idh/MocA family protein [Cellulomonas hominis]|uniref:Gfo/Idh/MocA family protein n=1 Tax=Cellulomonas hominis TaxID=156981 RepID=UPI001BA2D1B0|nr:Gfo/Idh/MocA family oxidoreductase [Cellulomonas hominis]VTR76315.1 4-carboxy-2-hydroxymuconate-6-semialdehyde dehydrogenase [Cellulomonas hominis]